MSRWQRGQSDARAAAAAAAVDDDFDDVQHFDKLLDAYFKPPAPPKPKKQWTTRSATTVRFASSSSANPLAQTASSAATADEGSVPADSPFASDSLKPIKQRLRRASAAAQAQLTARLLDKAQLHLQRSRKSDAAFARVLRICDEIFARSAAFRAVVAANAASLFERLLDAAGEPATTTTSAKVTLAPQLLARQQQARTANARLQRVLALIEAWHDGFGAKYPPIAAGFAALEQRGFVFPRIRIVQATEASSAAAAQALRDRVRQAQLQQIERLAPEIEDVIVEMNRIFDILVPTLDAFALGPTGAETVEPPPTPRSEASAVPSSNDNKVDDGEDGDEDDAVEWEDVDVQDDGEVQSPGDDDDDEEEKSGSDSERSHLDMDAIVQAYGLGSASYALTIEIPTGAGVCERSSDNDVLFRHLHDGILRIRKRFLPLVLDWAQHVQGAASSLDRSEDDRALAFRVGDLQQRLEVIVSKWEDLVATSEKAQLERVAPSVVALPLSAYGTAVPRRGPCSGGKRKRVVLHDSRKRTRTRRARSTESQS